MTDKKCRMSNNEFLNDQMLKRITLLAFDIQRSAFDIP
jgi:hypothetical protein